jgi:hypothetical protein
MLPERDAHCWHLGHSSIELNKETIQRHNDPTFAQRIPDRRGIRALHSLQYSVVTYDFVIDVRSASLKDLLLFQEKMERIQGTTFRATLLAPWQQLQERYRVTEDSFAQLREIQHWFMGDPRYILDEIDADAHLSMDEILTWFTPSSTPYHLFFEGDFDFNINDLVQHLVSEELGIVGVANHQDRRAFAVFAPALARAHRTGGWIYQQISLQWGVRWLTHERFMALYANKHSLRKRLSRFFIREFKKIRSFSELKLFLRKIAKILLKKVLPRD